MASGIPSRGSRQVRIPPAWRVGSAHAGPMSTATRYDFRLHALPTDVLADARARDVDAAGLPVEHLVAGGGEPLRCCLRDAREGEWLILFAHTLDLPASPYRETGPVFAHADPCPGPVGTSTYPEDWRGRQQVLRAYDERGRIHPATTMHDGTDPEAAIDAVLAAPGVVLVHSRNVLYGCYMFTVTRE